MNIPGVDARSLLTGGFVTGVITLIGLWIKKTTSDSTANIDDRGQFRRDLMEQNIEVNRRMSLLEDTVQLLQERENTFIRLFATLGGEFRVLNGHLSIHQMELRSDVLDAGALREQADLMLKSMDRINEVIEREERLFIAQSETRLGRSIGATTPPLVRQTMRHTVVDKEAAPTGAKEAQE